MKRNFYLILFLFFLGGYTANAQNLISNGSFESDFSGWNNLAGDGAQATFSLETADKVDGNKAMKVEVTTAGANPWSIQNISNAWSSETGKTYTLSFYAKAAANGTSLRVVQQTQTYAQQEFILTTSWQKYEWTFTAQEAGLQLRFNFLQAGTYYIDNINIPGLTPPAQLPNLITNGSFENNFTGWTNLVGSGANATFSLETTDTNDGSKAMKVEVIKPGSNSWDVQSIGSAWKSETGKQYTLTFYTKTATVGSSFKVIQQIGGSYAERIITPTSSWQKYEWIFTAGADGLQLKFHFPNAGIFFIDNINIPAPVVNLIPNGGFENDFTSWTHHANPGAATFSIETADKAEGNKAMKAEVITPGPNPWSVQSINSAWLSKTGQQYTLSFYAKAATAGSSFKVIQQKTTYAEQVINLTTSWQKYEWVFVAQEDGLELKFHFPTAGTFYIDNIYIPSTGSSAEPAPEPYTPTGPPIATGKPKFLGGVYSQSQVPNFNNYWSQVVPENAGKWGAVEATRDVMNWTELDASYKLAKDNGYPFRFHVLIWGNQQPAWIENLPPAEQLEEIKEWYAAIAQRYPDIDFIEVVNEPTHDPPLKLNANDQGSGNYIEALGGNGETGWDWVLNSFRLAKQYFPNTKLMLNDYSVENTVVGAQRYLHIVDLLKQENLIDIIGIQGHAFSTQGASTATLTSIMDMYAARNLPVMITELDIDGLTDQIQLNEYKRVFPIYWEHPSVMGITLWGYRPGHWRTNQGAYLAHANGAERTALKWLREYVQSGNNVNTPVITPNQVLQVSEAAINGAEVGTVKATDADANTTFNGWKIVGGTGASIFTINASTGTVKLSTNPGFDFEQNPASYTLVVTVHDGFTTSTPKTVTVKVGNANDNPPVITAAMSFSIDGGSCNVLGKATATDADDTNEPEFTTFQNWQITGGNGANIFAINGTTGQISIANPALLNFSNKTYNLLLTVSDGANSSTAAEVNITIADRLFVCHKGNVIQVSKHAVPALLSQGDCLGQCAGNTNNNARMASPAAAEPNQLRIYPNPAKGAVTIDLGVNEDHIQSVAVQDAAGRLVMQLQVSRAQTLVIPGNQLKPGIYLFRMQGDKVINRKVIIE
ncbi:endo-1,4-beta-xylanase [Adhaeribacter aquaticus]|uniref:endo-1,4-beta-xylanase n=1 Tax=Adhaeribacter aquaticus TaxID=299567 RepID=UPI00042A63BB|nr:endo-1,4-beta-xylanase [Adhaeribacter aquaticus]